MSADVAASAVLEPQAHPKAEFDYDQPLQPAYAASLASEEEKSVTRALPHSELDSDVAFLQQLQPRFVLDPAQLELAELIGRGAFGAVFRGRYSGQPVAVKLVKRTSSGRQSALTWTAANSGSTPIGSASSSGGKSALTESQSDYAFRCSPANSALLHSLPSRVQPLQQLTQEILLLHFLTLEREAVGQDALTACVLDFRGACYSADALMMLSSMYELGSVEACVLARVQQGAIGRGRIARPLRPAAARYDPSLALRLRIVLETAQALAFCHARRVIHHDVAARNLLLDGKWRTALADFGLAHYQTEDGSKVVTQAKQSTKDPVPMQRSASEPVAPMHDAVDVTGVQFTSAPLPATLRLLPRLTPLCELVSVRHAAPEAIRAGSRSSLQSASLSAAQALDVWAFAVTCYEVFASRQPYAELAATQVAFKVVEEHQRLPIGEQWPQELKQLLTRCWDDAPLQRPAMHDVVTVLQRCLHSLPQPVQFELPMARDIRASAAPTTGKKAPAAPEAKAIRASSLQPPPPLEYDQTDPQLPRPDSKPIALYDALPSKSVAAPVRAPARPAAARRKSSVVASRAPAAAPSVAPPPPPPLIAAQAVAPLFAPIAVAMPKEQQQLPSAERAQQREVTPAPAAAAAAAAPAAEPVGFGSLQMSEKRGGKRVDSDKKKKEEARVLEKNDLTQEEEIIHHIAQADRLAAPAKVEKLKKKNKDEEGAVRVAKGASPRSRSEGAGGGAAPAPSAATTAKPSRMSLTSAIKGFFGLTPRAKTRADAATTESTQAGAVGERRMAHAASPAPSATSKMPRVGSTKAKPTGGAKPASAAATATAASSSTTSPTPSASSAAAAAPKHAPAAAAASAPPPAPAPPAAPAPLPPPPPAPSASAAGGGGPAPGGGAPSFRARVPSPSKPLSQSLSAMLSGALLSKRAATADESEEEADDESDWDESPALSAADAVPRPQPFMEQVAAPFAVAAVAAPIASPDMPEPAPEPEVEPEAEPEAEPAAVFDEEEAPFLGDAGFSSFLSMPADGEPVEMSDEHVRRVPWSQLQQVQRFNSDVLAAVLPATAVGEVAGIESSSSEGTKVFGRVIADADTLEQLMDVHEQAPPGLLLPIAAVAMNNAADAEEAGALLVCRDLTEVPAEVSAAAGAAQPVHTLFDALQRPEVLGRCFDKSSGTSFAPVLEALVDYVLCVRFLWDYGVPFAAGGVRQLPFLRQADGSAHVQLPVSNLLLLSPALYPHLFDRQLSAEELDARSSELQTARYLSPEGVRDAVLNEATEAWAVGVTISEVLRRGAIAYEQEQHGGGVNQLLIAIGKGQLRPAPPSAAEQATANWPPALVQLMSACTSPSPANRPSLDVVLEQLQGMLAEVSDA